ncbi:MAG: calcium-binding protein [Planctomycetota bacterium]
MPKQAEPIVQQGAHLGEGALWDHVDEVLYWVDILGGKVFQYEPQSGENRAFDVKHHVGTVVVRNSGGLLVALQPGIACLDPETGRTEMLVKIPEVDATARFNDGKCDPEGRFWVGTLTYKFDNGAAALYRIGPDLKWTKMLDGITCSNGIVWSADSRTMYYIDTPTRKVEAFDFNPRSGNITTRRTVVNVPEDKGWPDGMAIDSQDRLWVAMFGGGRVCGFDPKTGQLIGEIFIPGAKNITSCAFGGPEFTDLYITSAKEHLKPEDLNAQPNAGHLFHFKMEVPGVPSYEFVG